MFTIMGIGFAVMMVVGFGSMAFWAGGDRPREAPPEQPQPAAQVFFQPTGWSSGMSRVSVEELVAGIEAHLARERSAAEAFARDPSARNLWLD